MWAVPKNGIGGPMPDELRAAAQGGIREAVVDRRWNRPLMSVATIVAAACAPVVWPLLAGGMAASAELTAVFAQVGGVGSGLITEILIRLWDRLGDNGNARSASVNSAMSWPLS